MKTPTPAKPRGTRSTKPASRSPASAAPAPRLDHVAAALVTSRRHDAQALLEAGRRSCSGITELLKRRVAILRETVSELRMVAKVMRQAGTRESVARLDGLARGAMQLTLNSIRELSALASARQKDALDILAQRLQADLAEFRQLRARRASAPAK